jgi:hypothetical protein
MTVNYTTLLRLVQPVTGTESGTWGDYVNNAFSAYADAAIAGTQTLSSDANATLTLTEGTNSASNLGSTSAQYAILNLTGSRSTTRTVTLPTSSRSYIIHNNTTGSATTVGGVSVAVGERCILTYDTNTSAYVKTASSISDVGSVTGTLGVANGGTGATSLTANNVILGNGTSAVQVVAPGTNGNVLTSNGTTWTSAVFPGGLDVYTTGTSASYTIPTGVTKIKATVIGGGGGGGGAGTGCPGSNGGGGGGGGSSIVYLTGLTPGGTITYTVGAGGTAGAPDANGGSGGASTIVVGATTYGATGGAGGNTNGTGGAGGNSSGTAGAITSKGGIGITPGGGGYGGGTILSPTGDAAGRGGGGRGAGVSSSTAGSAGVVMFEY